MRVLIASRIRKPGWELSTEETEKVFKDWAELRNKWASFGKVLSTFYSPGTGLPAPDNEEWFAIKIFEVPDVAAVNSMVMAYTRSEVKKVIYSSFIIGTADGLEKEWLEKQKD